MISFFPLILLLSLFIDYIFSTLTINSPQTLINELPAAKTISYALNNFGKIPYGLTLSGYLYLANPKNACSAIKSHAEEDIAFLLSTRGDCTYVTKAKYAQFMGVKLLIIISEQKDIQEEDLNDDGYGSSIHIPSIVINERYGTLLINYLESKKDLNNRILLTMMFEVNKIDTQELTYTFWLSSSNRNSYKLVRDFKYYYKKLKDHAKFEAHYLFWNCEICASNNYQLIDVPDNCVSGGRYCCSDPDGEGVASGRDIVLEDLRQICLFNENVETFFDYIDIFDLKCVEFQVLEECSRDILNTLNVEFATVKKCVDGSFSTKNEVDGINIVFDDNIILKKEKKTSNFFNVHFWPSVSINNMSFQGNLESEAIFDAICSFFNSPPDECHYTNGLREEGQIQSYANHFTMFLIIFLLFFFVFVIMIRIYKKIIKRELEKEMNSSIQNIMNQYINIIDKK